MDGFSDLSLFTLVARHRNLAAAARDLGVTPPAVSKRLAQLEKRLGVRLLNRTTRRVSLTAEGEIYLANGSRLLDDLAELEQLVTSSRAEPTGLLRVNASFGFGRAHIAPAVSHFVAVESPGSGFRSRHPLWRSAGCAHQRTSVAAEPARRVCVAGVSEALWRACVAARSDASRMPCPARKRVRVRHVAFHARQEDRDGQGGWTAKQQRRRGGVAMGARRAGDCCALAVGGGGAVERGATGRVIAGVGAAQCGHSRDLPGASSPVREIADLYRFSG
jgi:DNA-binding transcriptional LysR family regulator